MTMIRSQLSSSFSVHIIKDKFLLNQSAYCDHNIITQYHHIREMALDDDGIGTLIVVAS